MDALPKVLDELAVEYLPLKDIVALKLPITKQMLQHRVKYDPATLVENIGDYLSEDLLESFTASVMLDDIPVEFTTDPGLYGDILPMFIQQLIIQRLLPTYTPAMISKLITELISSHKEEEDDEYNETINLLGHHALALHLVDIYPALFTEAFLQNLTDLTDAILGDPDFVPTIYDLENVINNIEEWREDLAIRLVDLMYANGYYFNKPTLIKRILDTQMMGLIDRVLGTHLGQASMKQVLTEALNNSSLMSVVLSNPAVRPMEVINSLLHIKGVIRQDIFTLIRQHPRMHSVRPQYWDKFKVATD